jgi:hypothetical protein
LRSVFIFGGGQNRELEFLFRKTVAQFTGQIFYYFRRTNLYFPEFNISNEPMSIEEYGSTHELKIMNFLNVHNWQIALVGVLTAGNPYLENKYIEHDLTTNSQLENNYEFADYFRIDVSLSRKFYDCFNVNWQLGVILYNLTNHQNVCDRNFYHESDFSYFEEVRTLGFTPLFFLNLSYQ